MSTVTPIVITVLVVIVIGLIVYLSVTLSQKSSDQAASNTIVENKSETSVENKSEASVENKSEASVETNTTQSCMITFLKDDKVDETVAIGEPWRLDENNPKRCFAPVGQKCCEQTNLPGGGEGCMMDFTGYDKSRIISWKNECMNTGISVDLDKLEILKKEFSGDWIVESKNDVESKDDTHFTLDISNVSIKLKQNDIMYGMYEIKQVTINPIKHIQGSSVSDSGTKNEILLEEDKTGLILRLVEIPLHGNQSVLTTYKLTKMM